MTSIAALPQAEKPELTIPFLRLTDMAPVIMAKEMGFFEQYGLDVTLVRETSWANVRDRLIPGVFDAAPMLAPMPFATSYGFESVCEPLITGLVLSLNGNAITISEELVGKIGGNCSSGDAVCSAEAVGNWLQSNPQQLVFAVVHNFSSQKLLLELWLAAGGRRLGEHVRTIVMPPEQLVESLARGEIDGYCVGAPWNTVAVERGVGAVAATGYDIWNNSPEKVLGVRERWHLDNPITHLRLRLALMDTGAWLANPEAREVAAHILSRSEYLDLPFELLMPSLVGDMALRKYQERAKVPHFHLFYRYQAGFPWHSDAEWQLRQLKRFASKPMSDTEAGSAIDRVYRTDLYREAAAFMGRAFPSVDERPFGVNAEPWEIEPGIELGADLQIKAAQR